MTTPMIFLAAIGIVAALACAAVVSTLDATDAPDAAADNRTLRSPAAVLVRF